MPKKVTVASKDGHLVALKGGFKKAEQADAKPVVILRKKESKIAWWRPGTHWWSLPTWRVFQHTEHGVTVRRLCSLDVLA